MQVMFEFNLTLYHIDRDVYSILDLIGDVGGMFEAIFLFLCFILNFSQFFDFDHFLIEKLFR